MILILTYLNILRLANLGVLGLDGIGLFFMLMLEDMMTLIAMHCNEDDGGIDIGIGKPGCSWAGWHWALYHSSAACDEKH